MLTAFGNTETAISALKAGAFDFVNKPIEIDRLRQLINNALKLSEASAEQGLCRPRAIDWTNTGH